MTVLMLTVTTGHDLSDRYALDLLRLRKFDEDHHLFKGVLFNESGPNVSRGRNELVCEFLDTSYEWAWFVDSDIDFPPETMYRLLNASTTSGHKVMAGLYVMVGDERPVPAIFLPDREKIFQTPIDYPERLVEVSATGTGCMMIHRDVLEKVQADRGGSRNAWFWEELRTDPSGNEVAVSEDLNFCLRARESGFTVAVDCTVHVGHHKDRRVWWPEDCRTPPYPPIGDVVAPPRGLIAKPTTAEVLALAGGNR